MIKLNDGDFKDGSMVTANKTLKVISPTGETEEFESLTTLEEIDAKTRREWGKKGVVAAGAAIFTLGLALPAVAFIGNNKDITFLMVTDNGKRAVGTCDKKEFKKLKSYLPKPENHNQVPIWER